MLFTTHLVLLVFALLITSLHTARAAVSYPVHPELPTPKKQPAKATPIPPTVGKPTGNEAKQEGPKKSRNKNVHPPNGSSDGNQTTTMTEGGGGGGGGGEEVTEGSTNGGEEKGVGNEGKQPDAANESEGKAGDEAADEGSANAPTDTTTEGAQGESAEAKGDSTVGDGEVNGADQSNGSGVLDKGSGEGNTTFSPSKPTSSMWVGWHRVGLFVVAAVMAIGGLVVGKQAGFCRRASPRYGPVRREAASDDVDGWNRGWENDDWDEEEGKA